jgi:hypothetical protein
VERAGAEGDLDDGRRAGCSQALRRRRERSAGRPMKSWMERMREVSTGSAPVPGGGRRDRPSGGCWRKPAGGEFEVDETRRVEHAGVQHESLEHGDAFHLVAVVGAAFGDGAAGDDAGQGRVGDERVEEAQFGFVAAAGEALVDAELDQVAPPSRAAWASASAGARSCTVMGTQTSDTGGWVQARKRPSSHAASAADKGASLARGCCTRPVWRCGSRGWRPQTWGAREDPAAGDRREEGGVVGGAGRGARTEASADLGEGGLHGAQGVGVEVLATGAIVAGFEGGAGWRDRTCRAGFPGRGARRRRRCSRTARAGGGSGSPGG